MNDAKFISRRNRGGRGTPLGWGVVLCIVGLVYAVPLVWMAAVSL